MIFHRLVVTWFCIGNNKVSFIQIFRVSESIGHAVYCFFGREMAGFCVAVLPTWKTNSYEELKDGNFNIIMQDRVKAEETSKNCHVKKLSSSKFEGAAIKKTVKMIVKKMFSILIIFWIAAPSYLEVDNPLKSWTIFSKKIIIKEYSSV